MRSAAVGHVEWITFARVDRVPGVGEIAHATDDWEEPGGGGAVAAVQLTKLAANCDFLTAVGDDALGVRMVDSLERLGVRVHAAVRDAPTRRAVTLIDDHGERTITTMGRRLHPRADDPLPWGRLDATDTVYVTAADPGAFHHARRAGIMVVTTRVLDRLLDAGAVPDALVGSRRDPRERVDGGALPWRPALIVRTEGATGGTYETADGTVTRFEPAPLPGPVVDTYGGGDSFAAGMTFGLGAGMRPEGAIGLAARCGAACVTGRGPYAGQLTARDL